MAWACDTTGPILAMTVDARTMPPAFDLGEAMYRKIKCPVLMIHGDNDRIQPHARAQLVAEMTGAELVTVEGGGHNPLGRIPAKCNALIADFLDRKLGLGYRRKAVPSPQKARRALYLSSPIGLGHARRDIAVTRELRKIIRIFKSTGWRRTPSRGCSKPAARPSPLSAGLPAKPVTSNWNPASTTSTLFRRFAAWTRC